MQSETRQTLIGVTGMTIVVAVALSEGYNGRVTTAYLVGVIAQTTPEALDRISLSA